MKAFKYLLALVAVCGLFASCGQDIETEDIQKPYTYDDLYYKNLRDFKATDHPISFMWFAQYGAQNSMAVRFAGLPDSLDICSLWGGIPDSSATDVWKELRFEQKVKGTKMLVVHIVRMDAESADLDFKKVQAEGQAATDPAVRDSLFNLCIDMYADYHADQIFNNDLDGFDADYEPEGDWLAGSRFQRFMDRLALYMGPNPNQTKEERLEFLRSRYGNKITLADCNKLLCVDSNGQVSGWGNELIDICDYYFIQAYGGGVSDHAGNWPNEKCVWCENVGDNWGTSLQGLISQASYVTKSGGHKGGFGAFFGHRNYNITQYNPTPYEIFRRCIQLQNPAVH